MATEGDYELTPAIEIDMQIVNTVLKPQKQLTDFRPGSRRNLKS